MSSWPPVLEQLRDLCNFLRVANYRTNWQGALHASGTGDPALHLNHFSASFVRWRYGTINDVTMSLPKVRNICEQHCAKEVWGPVQDRKLLDRFVAACKDKSLWTWIATFSHAFSALHSFQTWARGWPVPRGAAPEGRQSTLQQVGRRVAEAPARVDRLCTCLSDTASKLTCEACEGDARVCQQYRDFLVTLSDDCSSRWRWVSEPPYLFAGCDDIDTASMFMDKLNDTAAEKHHRAAQYLFEKFGTHLRQVANGDDSFPWFPSCLMCQREPHHTTTTTTTTSVSHCARIFSGWP